MKKKLKLKVGKKSIEVIAVTSIFGKARGLMFSKRKNLLFIFDRGQRISLHMFFVFFPILVVFLDDKNRVVEKAVLKPFTFYNPKRKAFKALEISEKIDLFNSFIKIGSCLKFL